MKALAPAFVIAFVLAASAAAQPTTSFTVYGNSLTDQMGYAVACAGDVNGDGFDDIIVGAPFDNIGQTGSVFVFSGQNGALLHNLSPVTSGNIGEVVNGAGDVNGDGFDDLILGIPGDDTTGGNAGAAIVYSGFDGSVLFSLYGTGPFDTFGSSAAGAGDVNGDGFDDVIVGAIYADSTAVDAGSAFVFAGPTGTLLHSFHGAAFADQLGSSVAGAGDANGDGFADVVVGANLADANGTNSGQAIIYSGFDGSVLHLLPGASAQDTYGDSVSGAGDVNGDGYADVIVGGIYADGLATYSGAAQVFSGFDGSLLFTLKGVSSYEFFGFSVSGGGDVDGDGFDDVIVGVPADAAYGTNGGRAQVHRGPIGAVLHHIYGGGSSLSLGYSVGMGGDFDGDGFADFVIGLPGDFSFGSGSGAARAYLAPYRPFLEYRTDAPFAHDLDQDWIPAGGNPNALTGTIAVSGATPGGLGLYGASLARIDFTAFGYLPILIAIDPVNLLDSGNFGFDILGELVVPGVSRQNPFLAGQRIHLQFWETAPVIRASTGLRFDLVP